MHISLFVLNWTTLLMLMGSNAFSAPSSKMAGDMLTSDEQDSVYNNVELQKAKKHYDDKRYEESLGTINDYISEHGEQPQALWFRAAVYQRLDYLEKCEEDLARIIATSRDDPLIVEALASIGILQSKRGMHTEAITNLLSAEILGSTNDELNFWFGYSYAETKQYKKSIFRYKRVPNTSIRYCESLLRAATLLNYTAKYDESILLYKQVRDICPEYNYDSLLGGADGLMRVGKYEHAIDLYELALEMRRSSTAYMGLTYNYYSLGDYDHAIEYLSKWNELELCNKDALNTISAFGYERLIDMPVYRNIIYERLQDMVPDAMSLDMVIGNESSPDEPLVDAYYSLGSKLGAYYYHQGAFTEAREVFQALIKVDPQLHYAYYNVAEVSAKSGLLDDAIAYLRKWVSMVGIERGLSQIDASYDDLKNLYGSAEFLEYLHSLRRRIIMSPEASGVEEGAEKEGTKRSGESGMGIPHKI